LYWGFVGDALSLLALGLGGQGRFHARLQRNTETSSKTPNWYYSHRANSSLGV